MVQRYTAIRSLLQQLAGAGVIPDAETVLRANRAEAALALQKSVLAEVPAFTLSGNPEIIPGLRRHIDEHIAEILRLFAGGEPASFDYIKDQAHLRAEQRFPLEGMLHAYRCGHRVLSLWLRQAVLEERPRNLEQAISAVADFAVEYVNIVSALATAEYVAHTRILAEAEGDRRIELLNILLSGYDEADGRATQFLKRAGYLEQRQAYCVVAVQSANAAEMEHPARAQRIVSALAGVLSATPVRMLAGQHNNLVVAVLSDKRRQSGWTAPQSNLADRLRPLLDELGPAVLLGVSGDHPSTSFIPKALNEASIALDLASVANRVVQFSQIPIRQLLVHHGADYVQSAAPQWIAALNAANAKSNGALVQTLRAMAAADLNVQKAAREIGRHPNTVYARLERIRDLTGLDGQHFDDLTELLLGADCWRELPASPAN